MKIIVAVISLLSLLCLPAMSMAASPSATGKTDAVTLGVPDDVLADYKLFIAGRDPLTITNYGGPHSRRDVVEVILIQQALALGGLSASIHFNATPTYIRLGAELTEGTIAASGTSFWHYDAEKHQRFYHISSPVITKDQFEAGLYANPANKRAMEAKTLDKLRKLSATCNKNWVPDWRALKSLGLHPNHTQKFKTMVAMVYHQRADFLLAPFQQTENMLLHVDGMTLAPIPGIKVILRNGRHFVVSKAYPRNEMIFAALQKGLAIMKKRGILEKAYTQSGFFNPKVKNWTLINE